MARESLDDLQEAALAHLWMPTQDWSDLAEKGVSFFTEGDGVRIKNADGRWGYDGMAGLMLVNVGHGRREIVDAVAAQLGRLHYANTFKYGNEPAARFAAKVASLTPGDLNRVYFTSGGSEAVETALKIAYRYHYNRGEAGRRKFIGREGSYHGTTRGALSVSTSPVLGRSEYDAILPDNFRLAPQPAYYRRADESLSPSEFSVQCAQAVEEIIVEEGPETVAAVTAEPVSFSAGVAVPAPEYWPALREICDRHGVLLIADEVITGWGRTGKWFGVEHWGVVPDLMTMAKGITSGYFPVGACVARDAVFEEFKGGPEKTYKHGITYGGHPAGGAAGLANAAVIEREDLVGNSERMGKRLLERMEAMREHPAVGDVRGLGLMCAVELVSDKRSKTPLADTPGAVEGLSRRLDEGGLYIRAGKQAFFAPPLTVGEDDVDEMAAIFERALDVTERELGLA